MPRKTTTAKRKLVKKPGSRRTPMSGESKRRAEPLLESLSEEVNALLTPCSLSLFLQLIFREVSTFSLIFSQKSDSPPNSYIYR